MRFDVDALEIDSSFPEIDINAAEFNSQEYIDLIDSVSKSEKSLPDIRLSDKRVYK